MTQWQDRTTGERVKFLRGSNLTQEQLAEASGVSVGTVRKLEQGGNLSLPYLMKIASALGTDVSTMLGQQSPRRGMERDERAAIRAMSQAVHGSALGDVTLNEPGPLADLQAAVRHADALLWVSDYPKLGAVLSQLLPEARALYDSATGEERSAAAGVLADAYQTAAYASNLLGQRDLSRSALNYGRVAALSVGDDLRAAHLTSTVAWVSLRDGQTEFGVQVAERAAGSIEPRMSETDPDRLSVYGQLVTNAAVAASRGGASSDKARDLLSQAHAVAARIGREHARGGQNQPFGPSYVATQAMSVAIALGDIGKAQRLAEGAVLDRSMPLSTRARWFLDVALLNTETKRWEAAADELERVCLMAPAWVRHQALPGVVAARIADHNVARVRRIAAVARVPLGI
ncbi:helix-turn-helix domain-containing protein [Kitasatospora sp. MBT66]|uniref:helix-turn-helix domain-containing protein n=1 Tax=Kitasatospora sp. MBT66 TaxID=1444769 RepID=UPI0005BE5736|nr:helix-turn-helix transcriptional regulator [Kitasatospora sp. MBT66]